MLVAHLVRFIQNLSRLNTYRNIIARYVFASRCDAQFILTNIFISDKYRCSSEHRDIFLKPREPRSSLFPSTLRSNHCTSTQERKNVNNSNSHMTLAREQKTFLNTTANLNKHDAFVISFHDLPTSLFIRSFFQATYMCRLALFLSTMSH